MFAISTDPNQPRPEPAEVPSPLPSPIEPPGFDPPPLPPTEPGLPTYQDEPPVAPVAVGSG